MTEGGGKVEVIYALPEEQTIVALDWQPGMTAGQAVASSGLAESYPEITAQELVLGIWGVEVAADCALSKGDRVEISRPLLADPRDMRRELLSDGRVMGGASVPETKLRKKDPG